MRSRIVLVMILLASGAITTVAMAWLCAMLAKVAAFDPQLMAALRRDAFDAGTMTLSDGTAGRPWIVMAYPSFGAQLIDLRIEISGTSGMPGTPGKPIDYFNGPAPHVGVIRSGWPIIAMEGRVEYDASRSPRPKPPAYRWAVQIPNRAITGDRFAQSRMLPLKPLWPGFALSTLLHAAVILAIWMTARFTRRWLRQFRGRCPACAYPVGVSARCSECGGPVRPRTSLRTAA
jgi:hypothetical protein